MKAKSIYSTFDNPPGGILIWIIIFMEVLTFGIALTILGVKASHAPDIFHKSRMLLHTEFGAINTVFLLVSGFFMARAMHRLKSGQYDSSRKNILFAIAGGLAFIVLKSVEYSEKIDQGLTIGYNDFFRYYWMLTLFHVIHVLVGLGIISVMYFNIKRKRENTNIEDAEAGATFWHMCDLIWLLIFPSLYLLF